jgi:hypothetical protein
MSTDYKIGVSVNKINQNIFSSGRRNIWYTKAQKSFINGFKKDLIMILWLLLMKGVRKDLSDR